MKLKVILIKGDTVWIEVKETIYVEDIYTKSFAVFNGKVCFVLKDEVRSVLIPWENIAMVEIEA